MKSIAIKELQRNLYKATESLPVVVTKRNKPAFYIVQALSDVEAIEEQPIIVTARKIKAKESVKLSIDDKAHARLLKNMDQDNYF